MKEGNIVRTCAHSPLVLINWNTLLNCIRHLWAVRLKVRRDSEDFEFNKWYPFSQNKSKRMTPEPFWLSRVLHAVDGTEVDRRTDVSRINCGSYPSGHIRVERFAAQNIISKGVPFTTFHDETSSF
jgi:hypothetical protein